MPTESGVLLCPAQAGLAGLDVLLGTRRDRPRRLREALALGLREWDLVLLDCPPALGLATVNALVAADCVLTPIMPEYLAVKAVGPLSLSIGNAVVHNPALKHLGFLLTRVNVREALTATRDLAKLFDWRGAGAAWLKEHPASKGKSDDKLRRSLAAAFQRELAIAAWGAQAAGGQAQVVRDRALHDLAQGARRVR